MTTRRTLYALSLTTLFVIFCLSQGRTAAVPAPPLDAYSRFRDGPVFLLSTASQNPGPSGTVEQVCSLDVPAGLYVIFAKGVAKVHGGGGTKLSCTLSAGGTSTASSWASTRRTTATRTSRGRTRARSR